MSSPAKNNWITGLLLVILSILFALGGLELIFRLFYSKEPQNKNKNKVAWRDRPTAWYLPESSVDNRDFFYPREKPKDVFRIAVVGDSFTYGGSLTFDDSFPKRLERMLNLNIVQKKVEVMNLGVPGYNTLQELYLATKAIKRFNVDMIILEITLNDAELEPFHTTHAAFYERKKMLDNSKILKHWKSAAFIVNRIHMSMMNQEYKSYHKELFSNPKNWNMFENSLDGIVAICKSNHIGLFTFLFPLFSDPFDSKYPFLEEHKKIKQKFDALGMPFLDLLPEYQGIPPERLQAIPGEDDHPDEIAHRIAADAIYREITKRKMVPEDAIAKNVANKGRRLISPLPRSKEDEEN